MEIGLCPHLRIYPRTKLATPLGTYPLVIFRFLDSLWPFAPISFFFWFVNFWVSRIPWDTFWVTNPIWIVLDFEKFSIFSEISALWLLTVCGKSEFPHLAYIVQCGKYAVCSWLDCGNLMFTHCVQGLLAESFWKFLEFKFWFASSSGRLIPVFLTSHFISLHIFCCICLLDLI